MARAVEPVCQDALRDHHSHRIADALAERTGGGFHPGCVPPLRVSRRARSPLPERTDLLQRQIVPAQVEQRILQHGGVAAGEHEPVAVGPGRIGRIMPEELTHFDECFICGTGAEVTPVSEVGSYKFTPGNVSRTLIEDYTAEVNR